MTREWVLLNPGPANTSPRVRQALLMPDLCHREPEFFEVMRECRERLVRVAGADPGFGAVLFTGSGTAAVEATLASAVPEGRTLLVVNNGVYGDRMLRIARAHGIPAEALTYDFTTPVPPADVARALRERPEISHVAVVHHETTTGLLNPVEAVADVAAAAGRRVIVDAMSSLFGEPLAVAHEGFDYVTASANKCLQGIPGVSFVLARRTALEALKGRPARSVYLDLLNHWTTQEQDNTPFTPAVQVLHAMREALLELEEEGAAARIARYGENCRVLRRGMAALGFDILVPEGARSNILTTFRLRPGLTYEALHDAMKRRGYVIYAGQGEIRTYAFRVSNMGTLTPKDMQAVVTAFAECLAELGPDPRVSLAALVLVVVAAGLHAGWNAIAKRGSDQVVFLWLATLASGVAMLPLGLWYLVADGLPAAAVPFVLATIALHTVYFYALGRSYASGAYSLVYPVARGLGVALVPIVALLLFDERLSPLGIVGIALVVSGIAALHLLPSGGAARRVSGRALLWPIVTGLTIASYSLVDKAGVARLNPVPYMLLLEGGCAFLGLPLLRARRDAVRRELRGWRAIVLAAVMSALAYTLVLFAFRISKTGYVVAARELSIVLSAVIGSLWLREGRLGPRLAGAAIVLGGVACIALAR